MYVHSFTAKEITDHARYCSVHHPEGKPHVCLVHVLDTDQHATDALKILIPANGMVKRALSLDRAFMKDVIAQED